MAQNLQGLQKFFSDWKNPSRSIETVIFPSAIHLSTALSLAESKAVFLGGQDCSSEKSGAFTGEISALSLKEMGAAFCLIGHSEKRERAGETSETLKKKLDQAMAAGLTAVFCIGEKEVERANGKTKEILANQLSVLEGRELDRIIVAYEPVWAIGTGKIPSLTDVEEAHGQIWKRYPKLKAVLYGGSVKPENAKNLSSAAGVSGFLVGGASLTTTDFLKIAESML